MTADLPDFDVTHFLQSVDTSTATAETVNGIQKLLGLHLWIVKQRGSDPNSLEGTRLSPIWMDCTTAMELVRQLQAKIESAFPAEAAADRTARPTRQ